MMRIHKEGYTFVISSFVVCLIVLALCDRFPFWYMYLIGISSLLVFFFMCRFFRFPKMELKKVDGAFLAPADGKIVIIEEVEEPEFFKDKRIQVSIFMSVNNVHINWIPMTGTVEYFRHHQGKYLVAWHPKSSTLNERTSVVVNNGSVKVLFRQIAGYVARRIVCYVKEGDKVEQNQQLGFIKFGSRIDMFFPLGTKIEVEMNQKVKGTETIIAHI